MDRCVIISAGKIEDYNAIKKLINGDDVIVCADAGYIHAKNMGLKVDCVIGDFDSSKQPETENKIVLPVGKMLGDSLPVSVFEKYVDGTFPQGSAAYE